ncbi:MAG: cyanophycinase [Acidobacteriota bacterium]|jgi:cyanophycinase|nr:cyanophycinase [Acidobacteriota bacterium]
MGIIEARGRLVAVGGAEDKEGDCVILKEFVRLGKGAKARIVVMTVATDHPAEVGREYKNVFRRLGVDDTEVVDVSAREDASALGALELIRRATALYFTGGDQLHITSLMGGTEMQKLIYERHEKGLLIGGTSAGAAMMSNSMIIGGGGEENPRVEAVRIGPGMDLLVGAMIDTHFSQRGRHGRLLTAVAHYPQDLGLGIDENTALVVNKTEFEVIGEGAVTVIDAGAMSYTNLPYAGEYEGLALYGVSVHVLPAGYKFDLADRTPIVPDNEAATKKKRVSNSDSNEKHAKRTRG